MSPSGLFVQSVRLTPEKVADPDAYPFAIPAVRALAGEGIRLAPVTFFVGENGSGKSTLLEALAVAMGFNAEGGTKNFAFETRRSESSLHAALRIARGYRRPRTGFFLRAESFFNVATQIEALDREPSFGPPLIKSYGGKSLHEQSHGESFFSLFRHRFASDGLYLLDEPEAALSPARQLAFLRRMRDLVLDGSQFIIATHAPIVLAYPRAVIYSLDASGIAPTDFEHAEPVALTRDFLAERERYLARLFADE